MSVTITLLDKNLSDIDDLSHTKTPQLKYYINYNESVQTLLDKINNNRDNNHKILSLYNKYGQTIPITYRIRGDITFYHD